MTRRLIRMSSWCASLRQSTNHARHYPGLARGQSLRFLLLIAELVTGNKRRRIQRFELGEKPLDFIPAHPRGYAGSVSYVGRNSVEGQANFVSGELERRRVESGGDKPPMLAWVHHRKKFCCTCAAIVWGRREAQQIAEERR